jgi:hypothetical protein
MAENKNSSEPQAAGRDKKKTDDLFLPTLVEFVFTVSAIILIILFLTIVGVSLVAGAKFLDIVIRAGVAMSVVGGILMFISRQIFLDVLKANSAADENLAQKPAEK